jgi:hypothetical protein
VRRIYITTGEQEKGRTFQAVVLALVEARIWDGANGGDKVIRPALVSLACTTGEAAPLLANLRAGRKAVYSGGDGAASSKEQTLELLKSAGYAFATQRCAAGVRVDAFLPKLFEVAPAYVHGEPVAFVCLPDRAWLAGQGVDVGAAVAHLKRIGGVCGSDNEHDRPTEADVAGLVPYAPLFAKHVLGRCRLPLVPQIEFLTQVLVAALSSKFARRAWAGYYNSWGRVRESYARDYVERGVCDAGFAPGISFSATAPDVEAMLAEQTLIYMRRRRT